MAVDTRNVKAGKRSRGKPLSRKAKFFGLGTGVILVWQVVAVSLAAGHGDQATDLFAADSASVSQIAATMAAEQRLDNNDPAGAKIFARQALAISPVSAVALRDLGFAEEGLGNWQKSNALLSQAAALGWRDKATQLWLAQAYLRTKDYSHAAERLDAVLRAEPASNPLFDALDQLMTDKDLAAAMAVRLELNPGWRSRYLRHISSPATLSSRAMLMMILIHSPEPPSREDLLPTVSMLVRAGNTDQAKDLWAAGQHVSGALNDSKFENVMTTGASPFEWTQFPLPGASASTEATENGNGKMFSVTTDGSASGILLRQLLTLVPGDHTLEYSGAISVHAYQAFGWQIRCFNGGILLSTIGAHSSQYRFSVPKECRPQYIELRVTGDPGAAGGNATFHQLSVR